MIRFWIFGALLIVCTSVLQANPWKKKRSKAKKELSSADSAKIRHQLLIDSLGIVFDDAQEIIKLTDSLVNLPYSNTEPQWLSEQAYTEEYDANGNIIYHDEHYWPTYSELDNFYDFKKYKCEYDSHNRLITEIFFYQYNYGEPGTPNLKKEYTYDNEDNKLSEIEYQWDSESEKLVVNVRKEWSYNDKNQLTMERNSILKEDSTWEYITTYIYTYNEQGQKVNEIQYSSEPMYKESKTVYTYDSNGYLTSRLIYSWEDADSGWHLVKKYIFKQLDKYKYYLKGNYSLNRETDSLDMYEQTECEFNKDNQETYRIEYFKGNLRSKSITKYDSFGNEILNSYYSYDLNSKKWNLMSEYTYAYNAQGQKIFYQGMIRSNNSDPLKLRKRESYIYNEDDRKIEEIHYSQSDDDEIYAHGKNINIYNDKQKRVCSIQLKRESKTDKWHPSSMETNVYDKKSNLLQVKKFEYNDSLSVFECFYQEQYSYNPNKGNKYKFCYWYDKEKQLFKLKKLILSHYLDYHNDDVEIKFVCEDLAVGIEVTEARKLLYNQTYLWNQSKSQWEIYTKKENVYGRNKKLVKSTLYQAK